MAAETLRDWLLHYRRGGFDALYPKTRADRGRPRRLPPEVAELLLSIKADHPSWSVRQVIAGAVASGHLPDGVRPAHSTVHRLLRAEGLMSKPTATSDGTDRRRFSCRSAGQLWMSDVMHGPCNPSYHETGHPRGVEATAAVSGGGGLIRCRRRRRCRGVA